MTIPRTPRFRLFPPLGLALGLLLLSSPAFLFAAKKLKPVIMPDFTGLMKATRSFRKELKFYPGGHIYIDTGYMGNVTVVGGKEPKVFIEAAITGYGQTQAEMLAAVEDLKPRITRTETDIHLTTMHPEKFSKGKIDYYLVVPSYRSDLYIFSQRGFISIKDVNGWIEADTSMGYLQLINLSGYVSMRTLQGDVQAQLTGKFWRGLQVSAVTEKGDVKVFMPAEYNTDITLISTKGDISIDYPTYLVDEEESAIVISEKKGGAYVNQRIREGGGNVVFQTSKGHLVLQQYDPEKDYLDHSPQDESTPSPIEDAPKDNPIPPAAGGENTSAHGAPPPPAEATPTPSPEEKK